MQKKENTIKKQIVEKHELKLQNKNIYLTRIFMFENKTVFTHILCKVKNKKSLVAMTTFKFYQQIGFYTGKKSLTKYRVYLTFCGVSLELEKYLTYRVF